MPSAYTVHSEFGDFCLSPNLRRKVGLALAFIVFGSIAGASGIVVQMASHELTTNGRSMIAAIPLNSSAKISTSIVSPASPAVSAPDPSNSVQAAPVDAMTTAAIEPAATEAPQQSVAGSEMPQKTTRSQNRRDRDLYDAYAWRQQRADYGRGRVSGHDYSGAGW
jgi:hypothetical protein